MRAVVQRVREAAVSVPGAAGPQGEPWDEVARIGPGLLVLAGFSGAEHGEDLAWLAEKVVRLRAFAPDGGFDLSVVDVGGAVLVVSQFTLLAELARGRRPDFARAAPASVARPLYERFVAELEARCPHVRKGVFGAPMRVALVNDGPVTFVLERP